MNFIFILFDVTSVYIQEICVHILICFYIYEKSFFNVLN